MTFNDARVRRANHRPVDSSGDYVLYWMQASRRLDHNHALDHAIAEGRRLGRPVVVYEGLRLRYPWASERLHRFVLEGMCANAAAARRAGLAYWPWVERKAGRPGASRQSRHARRPRRDRRLPMFHRAGADRGAGRACRGRGRRGGRQCHRADQPPGPPGFGGRAPATAHPPGVRGSVDVNAFLDEAIIWRDPGLHWHWARRPDTASLERALPAWALTTLAAHAGDERAHVYSAEEWEAGHTHDPLWNAAQRELASTGTIHNYMRMLWGKKVLEWSRTAEEAYATLEHLNNRYAVDGRDPNSYTGILWCFGLFDRPWAPERRVLGSVRYMSSENTAKKFRLGHYLDYVASLPRTPAPRPLPRIGGEGERGKNPDRG